MDEREIVKTTHEAANEIAQAEIFRNRQDEKSRQQEEDEIYRAGEADGAIGSHNLHVGLGMVSRLIRIRRVKDEKLYRYMPDIVTWDAFCEKRLKQDRRTVERDLDNLAVLGEQFLDLCVQFSVSKKDIRRLRYAASEGEILIEDKTVTIGGELIPFDPDHAEDLEAAIEGVLEKKDKAIEELESTVKAKERSISAYNKTIAEQEKVIAKHERKLKEKGLVPGEEEFYLQLTDAKSLFEMWGGKLDPSEIDMEDASPRMKATLIETLGYMARIMDDLYQKAVDMFGNTRVDTDGYVFPTERGQKPADQQPEAAPQPEPKAEKNGIRAVK